MKLRLLKWLLKSKACRDYLKKCGWTTVHTDLAGGPGEEG